MESSTAATSNDFVNIPLRFSPSNSIGSSPRRVTPAIKEADTHALDCEHCLSTMLKSMTNTIQLKMDVIAKFMDDLLLSLADAINAN